MEIKEMLELHIKNDIDLLPKNQKTVLDYITNLQQKLEEYKDTETYSKRFLYKANKDRLNANLDLVKENERLKTKTKEQSLLLIDYQDMEQKLEDYKTRIEKAVEYIENTPLYETTYDYNMEEELEIQNVSDETASNKLLNILNGKE